MFIDFINSFDYNRNYKESVYAAYYQAEIHKADNSIC